MQKPISFKVEASNAKGDYVEAYFQEGKHADAYHNAKWYEVDAQGLLLWSMVRTTPIMNEDIVLKEAVEYATYEEYCTPRRVKGLSVIPQTLFDSLKAEAV
jgi:hypothetical protein